MMRVGFLFVLFILGLEFLHSECLAEVSKDTSNVTILNQRAASLYLSRPDSALILASEALNIARETNYYRGQALSHMQISHVQWVLSNFEMSIGHAFNALKIFDSVKDKRQQFEALLALGRSYLDKKDLEKSQEYYIRALEIAEEYGDPYLLSGIHRNMGIFYTRQKNYPKALAYSLDALRIAQKTNNKLDEAILYNHIGVIHASERNYAVALDYFNKSLDLATATRNKRLESLCYARLSELYFEINNIKESTELAEKSLQLSLQIGSKDAILIALQSLIKIYEFKKDYKNAFEYTQRYQQYNDSTYNIDKERIVAHIYQSQQLESQQREIRMLSQENELKEHKAKNQTLYMVSLLGGMILAIVVATLLYRNSLKSKENNRTLTQKNSEIEESRNEIIRQAANLRALNQVKDKLFSIIGHDLKGPIGNLQSLLRMFGDKNISQEEFTHLAQSLRRSIDNTRITLDNLLNWSLSQMDGIRTNPQRIMLKASIEESIALFSENAEQKNIKLEPNISYDIEVLADPSQFDLIIRNLISNAIKFTPQGGEVIISAEHKEHEIIVKISDTGIGMKPEQKALLFLPGTHQSELGTENEKGTGLGLMLCLDFVERNGGKLWVESKYKKGSDFYISLPKPKK